MKNIKLLQVVFLKKKKIIKLVWFFNLLCKIWSKQIFFLLKSCLVKYSVELFSNLKFIKEKRVFRFGFSVKFFFRGNKCKLKCLVNIRNKIKKEREKEKKWKSKKWKEKNWSWNLNCELNFTQVYKLVLRPDYKLNNSS